MTNLIESAKKKIEEASENFKLSDITYPPLKNIFKAGCKYGYEIGRDEREHDLSCVLDAATNGKWSKPSDKDSMLSVIHEEQENLQSQVQLLEDALKVAWGTNRNPNIYAVMDAARMALESLAKMRGGK